MLGDVDDIVSRLTRVLPTRWFGDVVPFTEALLAGIGTAFAAIYDLIETVRQQARLITASGVFLDFISQDFFGGTFLRRSGEGDSSFRSRIALELLRPRNTRADMIKALTDLTGYSPTIFEPMRPADTGSYTTGGAGYGVAGAWGNLSLPYQSFVIARRSSGGGIALLAGYGTGGLPYYAASLSWRRLSRMPTSSRPRRASCLPVTSRGSRSAASGCSVRPAGAISPSKRHRRKQAMDRQIVYAGSIPLDTDLLSAQRDTMVALGALARMVVGASVVVDGLACAPTQPASMSVTVGPGSITQVGAIDATPFGSLPALTGNTIVRIGININATSFNLSAPPASGQAINYLIQANLLEADAGAVVLPYYDAANPAVPFSGPNNSGAAQMTQRLQSVQLAVKPGAAAAAGSASVPPVDAGWVGLYVINVVFGQQTIAASNITTLATAPFLNWKLPQLSPGTHNLAVFQRRRKAHGACRRA